MITISLCIIVKNEEDYLDKCIASIKDFVDEIIIVDTGSTDNTKAIAEKYSAKIYDFIWCNDFAKARNFSFSKATKDYIFWLDADDILPLNSLSDFKSLKENLDSSIDSVTMIYSRLRNEHNETIFSLRRHRLVKRCKNFKWIGKVHEFLDVCGNIYNSNIEIHHLKNTDKISTRNLDIFLDMKKNNEIFSTRDIYYFANELFDHKKYFEASEQYELFLTKDDAWIEDKKSATYNLYKCYELISMNDKILPILYKTFFYDKPRADICCAIANTFFNDHKYTQAIFWYKSALTCIPDKDYMGFNNREFYTFIPAIQLCVCFCNLADYETAFYYNELAALSAPTLNNIEHNRKYLLKKFTELNLPIPFI